MRRLIAALILAVLTLSAAGAAPSHQAQRAALPAPDLTAPATFRVRFDTSKGPMVIEVRRAWAPHGADRLYTLARAGFFDGARFFRIRARTWVQFGIPADRAVAQAWRGRTIPDDPLSQPNARGTVAYAFKDPNGRTTQMFINLADNQATHDQEFVPFGRVVEGIEVADRFYDEYGERAGGGIRGGKQDPLFAEGNAYLLRVFPKLDYITTATIVK